MLLHPLQCVTLHLSNVNKHNTKKFKFSALVSSATHKWGTHDGIPNPNSSLMINSFDFYLLTFCRIREKLKHNKNKIYNVVLLLVLE